MYNFSFEYLQANGSLAKLVCAAHYEDHYDDEADCTLTDILGCDVLRAYDGAGNSIELAPWEYDDARNQAEMHAIKQLLNASSLDKY